MAAAAHCQANGPGPACVRPPGRPRDPGGAARPGGRARLPDHAYPGRGRDSRTPGPVGLRIIPADRPPPIIMASARLSQLETHRQPRLHLQADTVKGLGRGCRSATAMIAGGARGLKQGARERCPGK
eukprot:707959-Hanusia_phi.AAC.3